MRLFSIIKDSFSLLVISFIAKSVVLFLNVIATKYLSQSDFGRLAILRSTAALFESIFTGSSNSLLVSSSAKNSTINIAPLIIMLLSYSVFAAFFLYLSSYDFLNGNRYYIFSLIFFFILSSMLNAIYIGKGWYKQQIKLTAASCILTIPLSIFFVLTYSFQGAKISLLSIVTIDVIFKFVGLIMIKSINVSFIWNDAFVIFKRSIKYLLILIPQMSLFWYLKVKIGSNSLENLAIFEFYFQFITIIMLITGTVSSASINKFHLPEKLYYLKVSVYLNSLISFLFILSLFYSANYLVRIINEEYFLSEITLLFLLIITFPFSLSSLFTKYFTVLGKDNVNLASVFISLVLTYVYTFSIDFFGILEVIKSYLIYYGFSFLFLAIFIIREYFLTKHSHN